MTDALVRDLAPIWSVIIAIGSFVALITYLKLQVQTIEKRVVAMEAQLRLLLEDERSLRTDIASRLARIETLLETRPCVHNPVHKLEDCR